MPLMTRIRESLSTFFSVFAGLFVIYIVLDWGMDITGRRHTDRKLLTCHDVVPLTFGSGCI